MVRLCQKSSEQRLDNVNSIQGGSINTASLLCCDNYANPGCSKTFHIVRMNHQINFIERLEVYKCMLILLRLVEN